MSNISPGGEEFTGYDYVGSAEPAGAEEGQTWYDSGANSAFVFDGAAWIELSVSAHGELSNVAASDHHTRYSDSEAVAAADGTVDADTVDGQHASDLGGLSNVTTFSMSFNISGRSVDSNGASGTKTVSTPILPTNFNATVNSSTGGTASDEVTTKAYVEWGGTWLHSVSASDDGASSSGSSSTTAACTQMVDKRWNPGSGTIALGYDVTSNTSGSFDVDATLTGIRLS